MTFGIAAPHMRATASALFLFVSNIFGIGLGALLIGFTSDLLMPAYGSASIRYALLTIVPAATAFAALLSVFAACTLVSELGTRIRIKGANRK